MRNVLTLLGAALAAPQQVHAQPVEISDAATTDRFEIRVSEWVSLHFFAFHAARLRHDKKYRGFVALLPEDRTLLENPAIAAAFEPLARAYDPVLDNRLFRGGLFSTVKSLDAAETIDPELRAAFDAFMPTYRTYFWPRHRALAEQSAHAMRTQIATNGEAMANAVAEELGTSWGTSDYVFYLAPYTNWSGALSNDNHVYMSALDENIARYPLEMFFHESAHGEPIGSTIEPAADAALAAHGLESDRFWHYILFTATGKAAQRVLGEDYVPYSIGTGLTEAEGSKVWYDALLSVWDEHDTLEARAIAAAALVAAQRD